MYFNLAVKALHGSTFGRRHYRTISKFILLPLWWGFRIDRLYVMPNEPNHPEHKPYWIAWLQTPLVTIGIYVNAYLEDTSRKFTGVLLDVPGCSTPWGSRSFQLGWLQSRP